MAVGDSWDSQLITGLAQHLHDNGIGIWRPTGVYAAGEIAIIDRGIPAEPDRVVTLADYVVSTGPRGLADFIAGIQIRIRGTTDPQVCRDIGSEIFDLLDSSGRQTWGGIEVVDVYRRSHASLGFDAHNRWEASHNYYVEAMRPTIHRYR